MSLRLSALAHSIGAVYSRYADDLAFSGGWLPEWLIPRIAAIGIEEGFPLQLRKTRRMGRAVRQELTGLVVNEDPAPCRRTYDRLRAVLHQAALDGPVAANREDHPAFREHLRGRIEWVAAGQPHRRAKLEALFVRIDFGGRLRRNDEAPAPQMRAGAASGVADAQRQMAFTQRSPAPHIASVSHSGAVSVVE